MQETDQERNSSGFLRTPAFLRIYASRQCLKTLAKIMTIFSVETPGLNWKKECLSKHCKLRWCLNADQDYDNRARLNVP